MDQTIALVAPPTGTLSLQVEGRWEPMFCQILAPGHFAAYQDATLPASKQLACVVDLANTKCLPANEREY